MIRTILTMTCLMHIVTGGLAQNIGQKQQSIRISFNDSAARYALEHPAHALTRERESIWKSFEGYRITLVLHRESSFPVTWEIWERGLNRFLHKDTSLVRRSLELSDSLKILAQREHQRIVNHLSSYLPGNADFGAQIYFVAFTTPYAFCVEQNKIGIDITADEWYFDPACLLNMTIHEIFHVGFRLCSPDSKYIEKDPTDKEGFLRFSYVYLQSEGMATHVGYRALGLFPSSFRHGDYGLRGNDTSVRKAIRQINTLHAKAGTVPADSLNKEAWEVGVSQRAYYVAGAYASAKIKAAYGADYLAELITKGGTSFVKKYNELVSEEYRIIVGEV